MSRPATLRTRALSKRFGGLAAVDAVDLEVAAGELHALIGPNGAGKSTLVNLLAGALKPDAGSITLDGVELGSRSAHQRVALGLARSFQITNVFAEYDAVDNVALALQAQQGHLFNLWRARPDAALHEQARALLGEVALDPSPRPAQALAHGEQRKLEVALALATGARLLLLDEPLAGVSEAESQSMIALIARLKGRVSVLLIEHDMDAVFRLADRISVLVSGRLIATGTPSAISANEQVRAAYLGDEHAETA